MKKRVIIIGAGHGGVQASTSLHDEGFGGTITLISSETDLPYQKPPLSKGFLNGKQTEENLLFRNLQYYEEKAILLLLGTTVTGIDVNSKTISTEDEGVWEYDYLILATGARNRKLPFNTEGVLDLRTLYDAQQIKAQLDKINHLTVIGGGFIGLEMAAAAIELGKNVTVIEAQDRLMARVLPPILSEVFLKKHQEQGVDVLLKTSVLGIKNMEVLHPDASGTEGEYSVDMNDNQTLKTDLIVVGIGVLPNSELAEKAGLMCKNGISVNEFLETSDPSVFAIGDCASYYNDFAGRVMRLESVQNAVDQAKCVVHTIMGKREKYHAVPWFWTNQYDLKLQMAGVALDYDTQILRGSVESNKFSVFYFKDKKLVGVDSLNRPADHLAARKLLQLGNSPTFEQVEDVGVKLI
jgi:3-phenylpropionate/trans-cinnamate dioxygenase ferredoxin reductase component